MVEGHPPAIQGKRDHMSKNTPNARGAKKTPQLSIKQKRAAKREKREPELFLKPRKDAGR